MIFYQRLPNLLSSLSIKKSYNRAKLSSFHTWHLKSLQLQLRPPQMSVDGKHLLLSVCFFCSCGFQHAVTQATTYFCFFTYSHFGWKHPFARSRASYRAPRLSRWSPLKSEKYVSSVFWIQDVQVQGDFVKMNHLSFSHPPLISQFFSLLLNIKQI